MEVTGTNEILFQQEQNRLAVFPIKYHNIWAMYKKMIAASWTAEEVDMSKDKIGFNKLNKDEQHFIKYILAFFATSDLIVNMNLEERFTQEVKILEAKITYDFQKMMENIHSEVYSSLIETLIEDEDEKYKLFNAVQEIECINTKAVWAKKWIESTDSFAKRLVAFAIVEGIFFSGSFCSIFWLKQYKGNIIPGLINSNEFIARDEGMHTDFACLLYSMIKNRVDQDEIHEMFEEAIIIEKNFICESLPCKLIGMSAELMSTYIEFVADRLLLNLGYSKLFDVKNPFPWMENIGLEGKTNFFEARATQYQNSNVLNVSKNKELQLDEDF